MKERSTPAIDGPRSVARSTARTYVLAGATLGSAVLLRLILDPLMGDSLPLVTLFGAVAIAVWLGGYRPAVVVIALGTWHARTSLSNHAEGSASRFPQM